MERWKIIEEQPDYEVSSLGRIKNIKTKELKNQVNNGKGYLVVCLHGQKYYAHRLVGKAFVANPENKPCINHLDLNKANNDYRNLEWATYSENNAYGDRLKRQAESYLNNGTNCHKVQKLSMAGEVLDEYRSLREAERENGLGNGVISQYFRKNYSQCGGFKWRKI